MATFNRTKNSTRTFLFGVISKIIMIVCPFITRTLIIYKLGADYLGLSNLFTSVLSILSISELGLSSAIVFCLYKPVADDDKEAICALLVLLKRAYLIVGTAILALGLLLMPFLEHLIHGDYPTNINIYVLFLIYLLNSALSYLAFAYKRTLFQAYQREDRIHKIEAVTEIIKVILQALVLLVFANYYIYVAILPLSTMFLTFATEYVSKKQFPDIKPHGKVSTETKNVIKQKIVYLSAHSVASTLINTVDNIVISSFLGLFSLAVYGNYSYISSSIFAFILIAFNALRPAVANELNVDSKEKILHTFSTLRFICSWITMWCSICLVCLYQPFMEIWLGKEYLLSIPAVLAVVLYFYTNSIRQFYTSIYIDASGLWNKILFRQVLASVINLILDVVLVQKFGVTGVVFASFLTCLIISLPMDVYVTHKYVFETSPAKTVRQTVVGYCLLGVIGGITYYICSIISIDGILGLAVRSAVCILVPNSIMVLLFFKTEPFHNAWNHLNGLINKR